ncbi:MULTISPECIES: hypothetical protein [Streptomyces]|uniref:hypothetical protein n=1 Tax=Streptomyces TaxID=1883 RepID=UPI00036E8928|nr:MULTISPECIES: hypothetical protein [unclassified Streptomyces]MZF55611.1 hypothetical protein [Streptomyces sp. SID5594]
MKLLLTSLKRAWADWAVCLVMVVIAANRKSPFLFAFFVAMAVLAALFGAHRTWQATRPTGRPETSR